MEGRKTDHREIHNVFGMENARATYEGLLRLQPDVRPFVLTRAAYAGTQRYAATWTGDNSSTWNHMRISIPQLLNLGLSGYTFIGDDIGGFAGSPTPELLTRWMELGVGVGGRARARSAAGIPRPWWSAYPPRQRGRDTRATWATPRPRSNGLVVGPREVVHELECVAHGRLVAEAAVWSAVIVEVEPGWECCCSFG